MRAPSSTSGSSHRKSWSRPRASSWRRPVPRPDDSIRQIKEQVGRTPQVIIERDAKIANVVRIRGAGDGPRAVIFAGVHGDEVSGLHAVEKLLFDLFVGSRELLRGSLTLVRGNEQA